MLFVGTFFLRISNSGGILILQPVQRVAPGCGVSPSLGLRLPALERRDSDLQLIPAEDRDE